jgi:hypothetical protein
LDRGRYFFNRSASVAQTLNASNAWQRGEVSGVGHDPQLMANDALQYLFQTNSISTSFSAIDGGFENQTVTNTIGAGSATNLALSTTLWTTNTTATNTRAIVEGAARSGTRFARFGPNGVGNPRIYYTPQLPAGALVPNTTYQIQFFYKTASSVALESSSINFNVNNTATNQTVASVVAQSVAAGLTTNVADWAKIAVALTTNATAAGANGVASITLDAVPSGTYTAEIDDFVIYQLATADTTAPNAPGAVTAVGAALGGANVSWAAANGGVDGGGYVVVRYANTLPAANDDVLQNGIYRVGNIVAGGGVVRYSGSSNSFTDSGLSLGVDYYYKVYTTDKAYNYSAESTSSAVQSLATTYYYKGTAGTGD